MQYQFAILTDLKFARCGCAIKIVIPLTGVLLLTLKGYPHLANIAKCPYRWKIIACYIGHTTL